MEMSNAHHSVRYPKALLKLPQDEWFTIEDIATKLDVSDRTAYRWYTQNYLTREIRDKLTVYKLNENKRPEVVVRVNKTAPKKFTNAQLEDFYQKIIDGEMKLPMVDIAKFIKDDAPIEELQAILKGLEDYHELVSYVIAHKR